MKAMLNKLVKRDGGFTLTELAVAMVVVGILASIAVPSFLGARNNAFDREAQAAVDAALTAATLHYANSGDFTNSANALCNTAASTQLAADLQRLEPNYAFLNAAVVSDNVRRVSIGSSLTFNAGDEGLGCQAFHAAVMSRSGTCWVGRLTVEGKFLGITDGGTVSTYAIEVKTGNGNTSNSEIAESTLALNGKAYAGLTPLAPIASSSATPTLATVSADCTAADQQPAAGAAVPPGVGVDAYYESWRTVVLAPGA